MRRLMAGEPVDRAPVNAFASAYTAVQAGVSFEDYYLDPSVALSCQMKAAARHGWDGTPAYAMPGWATWDFGGEIAFPSGRRGGFPYVSRHAAESPQEVEALQVPDPRRAPAARRTLEFAQLAWGDSVAPCITGGSPLFEAVQMVGAERLLRWIRREPATVDLLLDKITDYILRVADAFLDDFGAAECTVFEAFPTESHALVSPAVFERFTLAREVRIHEELIQRGITSWVIHLCGDHSRNLHLWRDAVPLPERPAFSIGAEMDLLEVGSYFGDGCIVGGNVPTTLLQDGSPEEVVAAARRALERGLRHPGGYVLMPACGLPPHARPENVDALVETARTYGRSDH